MPHSSLQAPVGAFEDVTLDSMGKLTSTEASLGEEKLNQPRSFRRLRLPGQKRKPEPTSGLPFSFAPLIHTSLTARQRTMLAASVMDIIKPVTTVYSHQQMCHQITMSIQPTFLTA